MNKYLKRLIFAWKYKRAVKEAVTLADATGLKYYVVYMNGEPKAVPKKTVKELIAKHRFKKGTTIQDIEKRALFITK